MTQAGKVSLATPEGWNPPVRTNIEGVEVRTLRRNRDERGAMTEIFRLGAGLSDAPPQLNVFETEADSLRGMQVHVRQVDLFCVLSGEILFGLHDLRRFSPTFGRSLMLQLRSERLQTLVIPTGVCHGWYTPVPTIAVEAVTIPWDGSDATRCDFLAPELKLDWPSRTPKMTEADRSAPGYEEALAYVNRVLTR